MGCYVIVTCHSMLWSLLTILLTLSTLYCLTSTNWLVGYERQFQNHRINIANNSASGGQYNYMHQSQPDVGAPTYRPTIGLYNRCVRVTSAGRSIMSCSSFASSIGASNDVFPTAWQVSLTLSGVASLLSVFTMMCAMLSLCVRDFCRKSVFTIAGLVQVVAGLVLSVAIAIYPVGWSSKRVNLFCGTEATSYYKDQCSIGWAYIGIIACTVCMFPTGMLSIKADRATSKDEIEDEILKGKHLICIK